jgi:hypothetical protein
MEEDKESLCCTGVMDISSKPFKPNNKGDNQSFSPMLASILKSLIGTKNIN